MTDTVRTRAQMLALFADNTTGEISAQDLRDMFISLFGVYTSIKAVGNSTAQVMAAATEAKLINFTKNGLAVAGTPDYSNSKITLDNGGTYIVIGQATIKSSEADVALKARLALDDTAIDGRFGMHLINAAEEESGFCFDIVAVNAAQVLSLRVETDKITNLTLTHGQLGAVRIG